MPPADIDEDTRQTNTLPSFALAFPPSDTENSPTALSNNEKLPSILTIPRPQLNRNAHSDSGPVGFNPKRARDELLKIKDDPDDGDLENGLDSPTAPNSLQTQQQQQSPPKKKRRTTITSSNGPNPAQQQPASTSTTPSSAEANSSSKAKRSPNLSKRNARSTDSPPNSAQSPPQSATPTPRTNHSLPSSTPSFTTRRRAKRDFGLTTSSFSARKGAPSDLVISPPPTGVGHQHLQPVIQSAPPVPASRLRLHQMQAIGGPAPREPFVSISRVMHRAPSGSRGGATSGNPSSSGKAPKTAGLMSTTPIPSSVPGTGMATAGGTTAPPMTAGFRTNIFPPTPTGSAMATAGSTMSSAGMYHPHPPVPPTPSSLRHTLSQPRPPALQSQHSGSLPTVPIAASTANPHSTAANPAAKQAFLAPFAEFYDSLLDAHQLKTWLADQLSRSNALMQGLGSIEEEIERRVRPMREEVEWLRGRVGELEEVVLHMRGAGEGAKGKSKASNSIINGGSTSGSTLSLSAPLARRSHSPQMSPTPSPEPDTANTRRVNTSSSRLDPHPPPSHGRVRVPSPLAGSRNGSLDKEKDKDKDKEKEKEKEKGSGSEEEKKREKMETD